MRLMKMDLGGYSEDSDITGGRKGGGGGGERREENIDWFRNITCLGFLPAHLCYHPGPTHSVTIRI